MKKLILILILSMVTCSCTTNIMYVQRNIYIMDSKKVQVDQPGSEISDAVKGNKQTNKPSVELPGGL